MRCLPKEINALVERRRLGNCLRLPFLAVSASLVLVSACAREQNGDDKANGFSSIQAVPFSTKKVCADRAEAFLQHERSIDVPANGINAIVKNEQFVYNKALDTCLVYFEVTEFSVGTTYNIVDTLTNKKLYLHLSYLDRTMQPSWDGLCKASDGCLSEDDFRKKRVELFEGDRK